MSGPAIPLVPGMTRIWAASVVNARNGVETAVGVESANVTIDRKSDARRVVDCTITRDVDPVLLQAPHRLKLWSGYRTGGRDYLAPLAYVRIGKRTVTPRGLWQLQQCPSFESMVAACRFHAPVGLTPGTSLLGWMQLMIRDAVPWADIRITTSRDALVPAGGMIYERERWQAISGREDSIASALGVDVGCDGDGAFVIRDLPSGPPVWDVSEGPGGLLVDYSEELSPDDVTNYWVAYSDHPDTAPFRAEVADTDPLSPTNTGVWGEVTGFFASPLFTSQDMTTASALTRLANSRGLTVNLDMTSVPNPWQDITDPISSTRRGVTSVHVIDQIQHGWKVTEGNRMKAAARTVQVSG